MLIVVASTLAPFKCDGSSELTWLSNAEELASHVPTRFFAALEVDGRGLAPYATLIDRMAALSGETWRFAVDDTTTEVRTGTERHFRVCAGRNVCHEYALRAGASHLLFLDSDVTVPDDTIPKLLELDHPVTAAHVPTYSLDGPRVELEHLPGADVRAHSTTAGCLLLTREVFRHVAWHYDADAGLSDDPAFQRETAALFGETWVRHDLLARHVPETIGPVEYRGHDLRRVPW